MIFLICAAKDEFPLRIFFESFVVSRKVSEKRRVLFQKRYYSNIFNFSESTVFDSNYKVGAFFSRPVSIFAFFNIGQTWKKRFKIGCSSSTSLSIDLSFFDC